MKSIAPNTPRRTNDIKRLGPKRFLGRRLRRLRFSSSSSGMPNPAQALIALIVLAVGVGFVSFDFPWIRSAKRTVVDMSAGVFSFIEQPLVQTQIFIKDINTWWEMTTKVKTVQKLEEDIAALRTTLQVLAHENQELAEQLKFLNLPFFFNGTGELKASTKVLAHLGTVYTRNIIIHGGQDQFSKNDIVIESRGLVGRIVEVGRKSSRVVLIDDDDSRIPVVFQESGLQGIMTGQNDGYLKVLRLEDRIDKPKLQVGEAVVTSGLGGVFPPGIPVGILIKGPEDKFFIKPHVDLDTLSIVGVIPSYKEYYTDITHSSELPGEEGKKANVSS